MLVLDEKKLKTRKTHQCFGCLEKNPPGTSMIRQTNVDDRIYSLYLCPPCHKMIGKIPFDDPWGSTYEKGFVREFVASFSDTLVDIPYRHPWGGKKGIIVKIFKIPSMPIVYAEVSLIKNKLVTAVTYDLFTLGE